MCSRPTLLAWAGTGWTAALFRRIQRRARAEHEKTSRPGRQKRIISCCFLRISSKTLSSMVLSALIYCFPAYPTIVHAGMAWHARPAVSPFQTRAAARPVHTPGYTLPLSSTSTRGRGHPRGSSPPSNDNDPSSQRSARYKITPSPYRSRGQPNPQQDQLQSRP